MYMLDTTSFAILPSEKSNPKETMHDIFSIMSYEWDGKILTGNLSKGVFTLYFINDRTMRFICNLFGEVDISKSIAVIQEDSFMEGSLTETEDFLKLYFGLNEVILLKEKFSIIVKQKGQIVFQTSYPTVSYSSKKHIYFSINKPPKAPIYGLGEKTGFLDKNGAKISNWNTDVFAPHNKDTIELYQTIPFMMIHELTKTIGIFFDNTYRTEFDMQTYWDKLTIMAEGGQIDSYIIIAENIKEVVMAYTDLTGKTPIPPKWALGYHQSRYSYMTQSEVEELVQKFKKYQIPVDSIFLDIHYMDGYRVFTFDEDRFPKYGDLIKNLKEQQIDIVPIVDPGVKKDFDYWVYREGVENEYFSKYFDGTIYHGEVWPGVSAFPDFLNQKVQKWWGGLHRFYTDLGIRGIWNDMNEPSVFNETKTMDLDVMHNQDGKKITHREGHNLYGLYMSKATYDGLKSNLSNCRPFVLTRAGYAGIQRFAAVWTGDNRSYWEHLEMSLPMIMNMGLSGVSFAGADVGGFSSDTTPELLIRWTQVGAFLPYFRNHSVQDSIYQEPWAFGKDTLQSVKKYIELRYRFLPYIYTLFYEGEKTGLPVVRPLVMEYPNDPETFQCSDEFLLGSQILIAPIVRPGKTRRSVYFPEGTWYNFWTDEKIAGGQYYLIHADLNTLPLFIKEGTILPLGTPVKNTKEKQDIELFVYLSDDKEITGYLYEDDGISFNYRNQEYKITTFRMEEDYQVISESQGRYTKGSSVISTKIIGR